MDEEKKSTRQSCLWNRRGDCPGMIEKLTKYVPEQWAKTNQGKAISSDYANKYCDNCLMAKMIEQLENVNENLEKIYKKLTPRV